MQCSPPPPIDIPVHQLLYIEKVPVNLMRVITFLVASHPPLRTWRTCVGWGTVEHPSVISQHVITVANRQGRGRAVFKLRRNTPLNWHPRRPNIFRRHRPSLLEQNPLGIWGEENGGASM